MTDLAGSRILLTRSTHGNAAWAPVLRARGATPISLPCIQTQALSQAKQALRNTLALCDVLAFSSPRGVEVVAPWVDALPPGLHVAAVGPRTALAASRAFGRVDCVSEEGTGADLARVIEATRPSRVLVAGAATGQSPLGKALTRRAVPWQGVDVYAVTPLGGEAPPRDLAPWQLDAVFVASPSAVAGLLSQAVVPPHVPWISMGPTTSDAVRRAGLCVAAQSASRDVQGLCDALAGLSSSTTAKAR